LNNTRIVFDRLSGIYTANRNNHFEAVSKFVDFQDKVIVNIGCGNDYSNLFFESVKYKKYVGIDISFQMLKRASSLKLRDSIFIQNDVRRICIKKGLIDILLFVGSIEYLELEQIKNLCGYLLKEKGRVIVITPFKSTRLRVVFRFMKIFTDKIGLGYFLCFALKNRRVGGLLKSKSINVFINLFDTLAVPSYYIHTKEEVVKYLNHEFQISNILKSDKYISSLIFNKVQ
jgi:hypothetical protein|tara:strand:+ start:4134 stop:4823 length:690 start_codon:yes stop_codon:yes gene_type:complete